MIENAVPNRHLLHDQYVRQSQWFYGLRSQLLRKVNARAKRHILDLGCGTGVITKELSERCTGDITAVDMDAEVFKAFPEHFGKAKPVVASGEALPFDDASFDLVFTQMFFLWVKDPECVLREVHRVLQCGCELIISAEPDYGGCIGFPTEANPGPALAEALQRVGADPFIARRLPEALAAAGFEVATGVHPSLFRPSELSDRWNEELDFIRSLGGRPPKTEQPPSFLFTPYFWFLARKM